MGKKKWPALVLDADVVKVWLNMQLMHMQVGNAYHHTEGCGDMLAGVQAGEEQVHARVQLFATGIKTTVKQAACSPFHSTDASADDSALALKVCDAAATPRVAMQCVTSLVLLQVGSAMSTLHSLKTRPPCAGLCSSTDAHQRRVHRRIVWWQSGLHCPSCGLSDIGTPAAAL